MTEILNLHPLQLKLMEILGKEFMLDTELVKNASQDFYDNFKHGLTNHSDYINLKDNYLFDDESRSFLRILHKIPLKEIKDLNTEQIHFYPICNKDEIKRIFNPRNLQDSLLKYRAEAVIDHPRLKKVFGKIRKYYGERWNFSRYYKSTLYDRYLNTLSKENKEICRKAVYGFANVNEANGYCYKTDYGNMVIVSMALKYFLYYMNLYFYGKEYKISKNDSFQALIIAIRTMMGKETFDFEVDTRGKLPKKLNNYLIFLTNLQLEFVIGHEFAHHYLGHLTTNNLISVSQMTASSNVNASIPFYSYRHMQELDADLYAIMSPAIDDRRRSDLASAAMSFFLYLDIYESCANYISPPASTFKTHPDPIDRINELRKRLPDNYGFNNDILINAIKFNDNIKEGLIANILPYQIDQIEQYGSMYLPSFKKKIQLDHIDY